MEVLKIKFCGFEYSREATILLVKVFKNRFFLSKNTVGNLNYYLHSSLNTKQDGCTEKMYFHIYFAILTWFYTALPKTV